VEMREGSGDGESLDGGKHLEDDVCMNEGLQNH
jgi:hypothetical protein